MAVHLALKHLQVHLLGLFKSTFWSETNTYNKAEANDWTSESLLYGPGLQSFIKF